MLKEACEKEQKEQKKTAELTAQLEETREEIKELKETASGWANKHRLLRDRMNHKCNWCEDALRLDRANEKIRKLEDQNLMFRCQLGDAQRKMTRRWWEFW